MPQPRNLARILASGKSRLPRLFWKVIGTAFSSLQQVQAKCLPSGCLSCSEKRAFKSFACLSMSWVPWMCRVLISMAYRLSMSLPKTQPLQPSRCMSVSTHEIHWFTCLPGNRGPLLSHHLNQYWDVNEGYLGLCQFVEETRIHKEVDQPHLWWSPLYQQVGQILSELLPSGMVMVSPS